MLCLIGCYKRIELDSDGILLIIVVSKISICYSLRVLKSYKTNFGKNLDCKVGNSPKK
jgi:hypothetical protein